MKYLLALTLLVSLPNAIYASASEEACQAAIVAMGKDIGYATGYCKNTRYSAEKWQCALKYTSSGHDEGYALGACRKVKKTVLATVNKGAFYCKKQDSMEKLKNSKSARNLARLRAEYGGDDKYQCYLTEGGKFTFLSKYNGDMPYVKLGAKNGQEFYVFSNEVN